MYGQPLYRDKKNIEHLLSNNKFEFIFQDVRNFTSYDGNVDCIINLACAASPKMYQSKPIDTYMVNAIGVYNLLELAVKKKALFLLASTSEIYGEPLQHPQNEMYFGNTNPVGIRSCYDEGKRFAEGLTIEYCRQCSIDARIVRIFNTYGPYMQMHDGRVMPQFITQALNNHPISVYGNGLQTRSFCFVDDLILGLFYYIMEEGLNGYVLNMGNDDEITVMHLAEEIKKIIGSKSQVEYYALPQDDPTRRRPDITKAKVVLGWEPVTSLSTGLQKTIDFFKSHLRNN
jgi:nucleoside-diphosphate-sugar epimerase